MSDIEYLISNIGYRISNIGNRLHYLQGYIHIVLSFFPIPTIFILILRYNIGNLILFQMRKIGVIALWGLLVMVVSAQQPAQTRKFYDEESVNVLKELQKKISAYKDISIQFVFRSEKNEKFIDEIKGSTLIKGEKYVLKTTQQQIYCNGTTLWNYLPEQKEVTISLYDKEDEIQMMNPLKMIQNYEKSYKSTFIKETTEKGVLVQIIDLIPLKPSSYYKVRLFLDKNKKQITRVTVYEKDNTQYTYAVSKFEVNKNLSDEQFVFDISKYSGVEVIDIR